VGDPTIKPERQTEIEGGIDATLASGRANIEATLYQKNVKDLILLRTLPGSSGFRTQFFNGGELRDRGIEVAVGVVPVQRPDVSLLLRSIFFSNSSKIVQLPVPAFALTSPSGGFGTNLGQFYIQQGQSTTQIVGNVPDASVAGFHAAPIGDANPDFTWSFVSDLTVRRFNLYALADWQHGGNIINLTKLIWDFGGTSTDCPTVCNQRLASFGKDTRAWLESATYFKLREVTLSYTLPTSIVERIGGRDGRVSVSGRNLLVFTGSNYTGMDPEVSNFGTQPVARNIEVAQYPRSRSFWFTVSVGF